MGRRDGRNSGEARPLDGMAKPRARGVGRLKLTLAGFTFPLPEHCLIITEAGVNHNGDVGLALALVDAAADAGADAVKFQTFRTEALVTARAEKAAYQVDNTGEGGSQMAMLQRLELSPEDHVVIQQRCAERGITFLSTPFDEGSADLLAELGVPAFKLSSGDLTNLPFLRHVAKIGRPMIVSTGMADLAEVEAAVREIEATGLREIVLLHCVSNYPAPVEEVNLRAMDTMASAFGYPVGYSDHTLGDEVSIAAAARGARVIEKHFTLDRELPGPDHRASLEPAEIAQLVRSIRNVEAALGDGQKRPTPSEMSTARVARKSLVAGRAIAAGEVLAEADVAIRRPADGLPPRLITFVVGRRARRDLAAGDPITLAELD